MKKLFTLLLTLVATTALWAYDFKYGDLYYNITSSVEPYTVEVTYEIYWSCDNYRNLKNIVIPENITYNNVTYLVTSIGDDAFACPCTPSSSQISSIVIPNSVTSIGEDAFHGCSSLTSITIPNSVTEIGFRAFSGCSSLTSITIPNSVTEIGSYAFSGCSGLTSVIVEEGNTIYDSRENCNAIIETATNTLIKGCQNTIIPNSVTEIGRYAFEDCSGLTSITIPNSVTSIGSSAFQDCSSLTSITIPNSVTSIGWSAFDGCSSLTSVTIPNSVTEIENYAFEGTGIYNEESNWENDVLYIDNCLIKARTSISGAYTIKDNTRLIADYAFSGCSSLTSITIPNSVMSIGSDAFYNCAFTKDNFINNSTLDAEKNNYWEARIGDKEIDGLLIKDDTILVACRPHLTSVTIPNSVTEIGSSAFYDCTSLTSVTIPNSVTYIGEWAFAFCSSLTSVTIPNSVTEIGSYAFEGTGIYNEESNWKNDVLYIDNCLIKARTSISGAYTIKDNTRLIADYAFSGCSSLTSVTIPNSVTSIEDYAFYGCSSLTSITIPNSVTSIGSYAFAHCSSLTSITIPNSVTSIGNSAFYACSSLTKTNYTGDIAGWCDIKFVGNLANPIHYSHNFYINDVKIKDLVIPNSVDSIYDYAFYGCSSLTSITIPYSVTSIEHMAFEGCSGLTSVIWNAENCADFSSYSYAPFYYISSQITSFTFGDSVQHIPAYLCYDMDSLRSVTIPNRVDSIGEYAFAYCDSLRFIFSAPLLPPAIESNVFGWKVYDNATLHVLSSDYKTHNVWKQFDSIQVADTIYSDGIRYKVINKSGELLSESLLTEESFNKFTRVSVEGTQTWRYDSQYGAKMSGFQDNVTHTNEDWFISPALDLEGCSSATLTFSHAFGPKSSIPTTDSQKAQYTIWVSNDFEGDVNAATWTKLKGMIYGDTGWGFVSSGDITIPTENLKGNCRVAWKYVCENSSATWEIKNVSLSATINTNTKPTLQVINGESPYSGDIAIPSVVKYMNADLEVASIGNIAFRNCSSLNSVTIENGITTIEEYAFYNSSLTSIYLPNTLTNIGYSAFRGCSSLISIAIPNGVTTIRNNTFSGCSFLTSATISNGVMAIDKYAFADCLSLNTISVPNSVTRIGQSTFKNCTSLVEVTLSNEMNTLEKETFQDCSSLKFVRLGGKLTTIGESVFSACTALNEITLPASVKSIGENAFAGCTKLYDVYCYGMEPPTAYESSFANYNAFLHVPCDNQRVYLLDILFGNFKYVECIEAETTPTDTVVVTPSFNDAEFIWPSNSSADSYTLAISKDGEVFCTLTFNANGQLTGIAFAPSRNGQHNAPAAAQTANGFAFTVTGLDEGSNYTYDLLIKDRSGNTLQSYSGEFRTQSTNDRTVTVEYDAAQGQVTGAGTYLVGDTVTLTATPNDGYRFVRWSNEVVDNPYTFVISEDVTLVAEFEVVINTSVENTPSPIANSQKLLRNGQLIILRDGKEYNTMGQEL